MVEDASKCPSFHHPIDDKAGYAEHRAAGAVISVPVLSLGREVCGVLTLVKDPDQEPFSAKHIGLAEETSFLPHFL